MSSDRVGIEKIVRRWLRDADMIILDLEDSVERGEGLLRARERCATILRARVHWPEQGRLAVRINAHGSQEQLADLEMLLGVLESCPQRLTFVLPMVEDETHIRSLADVLAERAVDVNIQPICETVAGVRNLEKIAQALPRRNRLISFGLLDYQYECEVFPFMLDDDPRLLSLLKELSDRARKHNCNLVLGPFKYMRGAAVSQAVDAVEEILGIKPYYNSLNQNQTLAIRHRDTIVTETCVWQSDPIEYARQILGSGPIDFRLAA